MQELFPTIYTLFKTPWIVPTVFYLKSGVESYLINGADLMWPGVERVEYRPDKEEEKATDTTEEEGKDKYYFKCIVH